MPKAARALRWCFTLNNPTSEELEFLHQMHQALKTNQTTSTGLTYLVTGKEVVTTPHIQGYLECKKISLPTLKAIFLARAHWEKARENSKIASDYCKKDGIFEESGVLKPGQGYRTDLADIKEALDNGATDEKIADEYFSRWVVYRRAFQAYTALKATPRNWETTVIVLWGKTGTGKTRFAMDQTKDTTFWIPGDYQWFDGYNGQEIVIFDDYRGEYKLQMLLKLLDRYPMSVPIKGGFTNWAPKTIYITSNINPNHWYGDGDTYSVSAMYRRITTVRSCFESLYDENGLIEITE